MPTAPGSLADQNSKKMIFPDTLTPSPGGWSLQLMVEDQELETAKTTMSKVKGFMLETTPTNP